MEWNILEFALSGWFGYWLIMLIRGYRTNKETFSIVFFAKDNALEFAVSFGACFLVVLWGLGNDPTDMGDKIMDAGIGATAGTTLDGFITSVKPAVLSPTPPTPKQP